MGLENPSDLHEHWAHPPQGIEMDEYLVIANKWIVNAWQSVRGSAPVHSPTYSQYKRVVERLGYFSLDVLSHAAIWMNSEEEEIANGGANVITHHYLHPVIKAIDRVSAKFPDSPFDKEEMISWGIAEIIDQVMRRGIRKDLAININTRTNRRLYQQRHAGFTEEFQPREVSAGLQPQLERLEKIGEERKHNREYDFESLLAQAKLRPREVYVIRRYFGFHDDIRHTEKDLGEELGVSRARIGQIIESALEKLKRKTVKLS